MAAKTLYQQVTTSKNLDELKQTAMEAFRSVGGTMQETLDGFQIKQGVNGVNFAFTAKMDANVRLREIKPNEKYEIECLINWSPSVVVWVCLLIGLFVLGALWLVAALYLFINPGEAYMQALNRTQQLLV